MDDLADDSLRNLFERPVYCPRSLIRTSAASSVLLITGKPSSSLDRLADLCTA